LPRALLSVSDKTGLTGFARGLQRLGFELYATGNTLKAILDGLIASDGSVLQRPGRTDRLTRDPLFMSHLRNADFEKGLEGWTLRHAEAGTIEARSFPRYGRIEGRYMGLGRPADPEHIGDTFLWMKRSRGS